MRDVCSYGIDLLRIGHGQLRVEHLHSRVKTADAKPIPAASSTTEMSANALSRLKPRMLISASCKRTSGRGIVVI